MRQLPSPDKRPDYLTIILLVFAALGTIALLRVPGVVIVLVAMVVLGIYLARNTGNPENRSLRGSIALSAETITAVLDEYDHFAASPDAEHLADRTLHRPALLDPGCTDPDVATFHHHRGAAERYLKRLEHHLQNPDLTIRELESLLQTTDDRARQLEQAWWDARQAALKLGPGR